MSKTIIYVGAGWDNTIIKLFPNYERYILIDTLPKIPHYTENQHGYKYSCDEETFFNTLKQKFGEYIHDIDKDILYFSYNVEYWYNCDCNTIIDLPEGDIYLSGLYPTNWDNYKNRKIYSSCINGALHLIPVDYETIHSIDIEEPCRCFDSDEDEWDDDECDEENGDNDECDEENGDEENGDEEEWDDEENSDDNQINELAVKCLDFVEKNIGETDYDKFGYRLINEFFKNNKIKFSIYQKINQEKLKKYIDIMLKPSK